MHLIRILRALVLTALISTMSAACATSVHLHGGAAMFPSGAFVRVESAHVDGDPVLLRLFFLNGAEQPIHVQPSGLFVRWPDGTVARRRRPACHRWITICILKAASFASTSVHVPPPRQRRGAAARSPRPPQRAAEHAEIHEVVEVLVDQGLAHVREVRERIGDGSQLILGLARRPRRGAITAAG